MKRTAIILLLVCGLNLSSKAQKECVKQGSILVDGYVGVLNPYNFILKLQVITDYGGYATNIYTTPLGTYGLKGEYLFSNLIGLGADLNYTNSSITFKYTGNGYINGSGNSIDYTWNAITYRAMVGLNFHYLRLEKFEMYSGVLVGYYSRVITRSPVDPNRTNPQYNITPVAVRIETGWRYFIVPNVGILLSVGIGINGGPVFGLGLSGNF